VKRGVGRKSDAEKKNGRGGSVNRNDEKWRWESGCRKIFFDLHRTCVKLHKGRMSVHKVCTLLCRFRQKIKSVKNWLCKSA